MSTPPRPRAGRRRRAADPAPGPVRTAAGAGRRQDRHRSAGPGPEHLGPPGALAGLAVTSDRGGVVLGSDQHGTPVQLTVVRPEPTRVVLVGGLYLARQVVLRALATGVSVVVATGRPAAWAPVVRAVGAPSPALEVRGLTRGPLPRPSEDHPLLVVLDGGAVPQEIYPPRSAWHTTMSVLPYLHPQLTGADAADLVLLQRLPVGQAQLAASTWRLSPDMARQLAGLTDDGAVALGTNLWVPVRLVTTRTESELLGPVRRGD